MKKNYWFLLFVLFSCTGNKPEKALHILTRHAESISGNIVNKDSVSAYTADYFEIELASYKNDSAQWFEAKRDIANGYKKGTEIFFVEYLKVSDDKGKPLTFTNSTEFLNYMSAFGYEMVTQDKKQYSTAYTFKKKK